MANLAEKHNDEHGSQLADSEILRILSTLQKAEFKRSESGNARPDQAFRPRSLMEIAETARQQHDAEKAATLSAEISAHKADFAADETVDDVTAGSGEGPTEDKASEVTGDNQSNGQQSAVALDNASQETGLEMPPTESNKSDPQDLPATDAGMKADASLSHRTDNEVGPASPTSPFETAQVAFDRGYGEGVAAGREAAESELRTTIETEFEAKLAGKINAFETALDALAKPQTADTKNLSASLQAAVVRLATARAGMEIDQLPKSMVTRIENLADAAGKKVSAGIVFIHPDDCAAIAPIMGTARPV